MDLVEIRKKSKQKQRNQQEEPKPVVVVDEVPAAGVVTETAPNAVTANEPKPLPRQAEPATAVSLPAAKLQAADSQSALDQLEALFANSTELTLATEEVYLQGLQGESREEAEDQQQWLTFNLGKEQYALDIVYVREIIKPREVTDIPRVPGFILGVISLRGVIVPIYDLRQRLNLGEVTIDARSRIIVCEHGDRVAGLLVDNITQVVTFSSGEIEPPPAILSGLDRELVGGVGRIDKRMIILLDLLSVLDVELN